MRSCSRAYAKAAAATEAPGCTSIRPSARTPSRGGAGRPVSGLRTEPAMISADEIVRYLRKEAGRPLKARELAKALGIEQADYREFRALLRRMEAEGTLYRGRRQRYA